MLIVLFTREVTVHCREAGPPLPGIATELQRGLRLLYQGTTSVVPKTQ